MPFLEHCPKVGGIVISVNDRLQVSKQKIYNSIGYHDEYEPSTRIVSLVDDYVRNYHDFLSPAYSHAVRDIKSIKGSRITISDSIIFKSKILADLLKRCDKIVVFALTIGNYLEEMVDYLSENGLVVQATVLDAIGSGTAEKLAANVEDSVRLIAQTDDMVISRRFSPGYCDWDVSQQAMVFQTLDRDSCGIHLTDSMLMIPRKSVSGIIGLGLPGKGIEEFNPCQTCREKDCPGRRR